MLKNKENSWFEVWFDSPFYHILYGNRDYSEADAFVKLLIDELCLPKGSSVLDLACGKGRHAISMNKLGLNVLGVDLAVESIREAQKHENEHLHFAVHDMRQKIENRQFTAVFNLFTSFGYFDSDSENLQVLQSVHSMLAANGVLVIDFMNARKVIANLVAEETKTCERFRFDITRRYEGKHIVKQISLQDGNKKHVYQERVQALELEQFQSFLEQAGFALDKIWGSYQLEKFDIEHSDRLILVAVKK